MYDVLHDMCVNVGLMLCWCLGDVPAATDSSEKSASTTTDAESSATTASAATTAALEVCTFCGGGVTVNVVSGCWLLVVATISRINGCSVSGLMTVVCV